MTNASKVCELYESLWAFNSGMTLLAKKLNCFKVSFELVQGNRKRKKLQSTFKTIKKECWLPKKHFWAQKDQSQLEAFDFVSWISQRGEQFLPSESNMGRLRNS